MMSWDDGKMVRTTYILVIWVPSSMMWLPPCIFLPFCFGATEQSRRSSTKIKWRKHTTSRLLDQSLKSRAMCRFRDFGPKIADYADSGPKVTRCASPASHAICRFRDFGSKVAEFAHGANLDESLFHWSERHESLIVSLHLQIAQSQKHRFHRKKKNCSYLDLRCRN